MKREYQIDVSITGVESLERDHGGYKYLYYKLKYMYQNIRENILDSSRAFQFQNFLQTTRTSNRLSTNNLWTYT